MSSIWKTKLKRVRKHALSAATSFILYMLFYRIVLISLTIFRLKCSNFYIENLKYNSAKDSSCLISFKSDAFSPLYIDFYSSTASVCIETPRGIYSVCELSFGHIELNKFGNIEFNSTVALNHIDFSKIPAFLNSNRKITLELSMVVSLRFLLIPLTFVVNKKLFKIDQMLLDNNANSGFKDKNMVIDQFFKSLNVQPDRRSRENLEKCDLLKSFDIKNVQFEGRCYNRVVLSFMPLHGAKLIKDVDLHFENFHLNFTMPIPLRVIVKDVSMSSAGYRLDVLVPDIGSPNIIVKILQIYWEKKLIHIEVDRVWHRKSSVANQKTSSEQDVLVYQKSNERNLVSLTIPFSEGKLHLFNGNWKVRDFHILPGKICWKCIINCNKKTLILGCIVQQLLANYIPEMSMRLNDSHLCTIKLSLLNPLENIADCGSEFVYMAFSVYFDSMSSIVLYSDKPVDNIRLSFKSCHPKTMWLDKLEMQMKRGDSYLLIYENTMVKMLAKSYPACKAKTVDFLLEHRLRKPAGHDLFVLVTTFSNCKYKKVANLKLLVEFPEFILRFKCPKGCIQLKNTCQNFIGINFNEDNDGINEIFHNIEIELKAELFEEYEKFDSTALNDIFNSNIVFEINDCIRIPVKIAKQLSAPTKAAKDSSPLKVFPCLEIGHLDSKSFFHHCFSISSNSKTQNAEEIATIQKNNSFAIKNRIFLNDITANYKVLGSVLMIRAEQPSFQIDVSETYIAIKALNPTTVVVQMCPGNLDTHSAEDSVTLKLISFLLSVDFSSFAKDRPEKFIETDKNSVISSYFKLSEKSSTLHMNFSVEIPKSVFGIPDDLKLNIANALALTISPNGDKGKRVVMSAQVSQNATHSKISLSVNGTLDFSAESYLVSLSVDGNLVEERRIDRRVICQLYNDAIRVSKKTKQDDILERETINVADGNKHGMKDAENSMLHIEPVSFKATSRTEMRLGFRVYSEKLDEILVKSCEDVLNSLPLSKFPNFMEISIEVVDVPSVMLSIVKPDESEVPFLALNRLSIIISKKRYELRCPDRSLFRELTSSQDHYETTQVLKRILKNNKKEIDRFLKHMPLKRLHSSMLGAPIQLQFGIDTERLREYKGTNDDEHVKVVVAESNCRRIYKILYSTARSMNIPLPNGLFTKTRRTAVDMVYSIMDRFLPKQRSLKISTKILTKVGAVLIKSKTRINVVCEPVSVFLVTPGGNMVHFRLFGLQFDGMPYENQYQIVFPFVVYSREGFLVGIAKDPNKHLSVERNVLIFRLIIVFRDERHEIEIETSNFQPFEIIVRTFDGLISDCILPSYIHVLVNRLKQVGYFRTWFIDIGNQSVEEAEKNANIDAEEMERDRKVALGQAL